MILSRCRHQGTSKWALVWVFRHPKCQLKLLCKATIWFMVQQAYKDLQSICYQSNPITNLWECIEVLPLRCHQGQTSLTSFGILGFGSYEIGILGYGSFEIGIFGIPGPPLTHPYPGNTEKTIPKNTIFPTLTRAKGIPKRSCKMQSGIVHHKSDCKSCVLPTADRNNDYMESPIQYE